MKANVLYSLFLVVGVCTCQSASGDGGVTDTNTNWLSECDTDGECDGLACLCGLCTTTCTNAAGCNDLSSEAECREGSCGETICVASDTQTLDDDGATSDDDASGGDDTSGDDDGAPTPSTTVPMTCDDTLEDCEPGSPAPSETDDNAVGGSNSDGGVSSLGGSSSGGEASLGGASNGGAPNGGSTSSDGGSTSNGGAGGVEGIGGTSTGGTGGTDGTGGAANQCRVEAEVCLERQGPSSEVTVIDEPCCDGLTCDSCVAGNNLERCTCTPELIVPQPCGSESEPCDRSCGSVCTIFEVSNWCSPEMGFVDETLPIEWVCGAPETPRQELLDNCVNLATGADRWCCPPEFNPVCAVE